MCACVCVHVCVYVYVHKGWGADQHYLCGCLDYKQFDQQVCQTKSFDYYHLSLYSPTQQYSCKYSKNNIGAKMSGTVAIKSGSESSLQAAVANVGPVSVAVDAASTAFRVSSAVHFSHVLLQSNEESFQCWHSSYWCVKHFVLITSLFHSYRWKQYNFNVDYCKCISRCNILFIDPIVGYMSSTVKSTFTFIELDIIIHVSWP